MTFFQDSQPKYYTYFSSSLFYLNLKPCVAVCEVLKAVTLNTKCPTRGDTYVSVEPGFTYCELWVVPRHTSRSRELSSLLPCSLFSEILVISFYLNAITHQFFSQNYFATFALTYTVTLASPCPSFLSNLVYDLYKHHFLAQFSIVFSVKLRTWNNGPASLVVYDRNLKLTKKL